MSLPTKGAGGSAPFVDFTAWEDSFTDTNGVKLDNHTPETGGPYVIGLGDVDIQTGTAWEAHGAEGNPGFWEYDPADHDLFDFSRPDFHLTAASANAIDRGTTALPGSLVALLDVFDVDDPHRGDAFDIGRYEAGFALLAEPLSQAIESGGVTRYSLRLHPTDLPHAVTLATTSPSPSLALVLNPTVATSGTVVSLTVTHSGTPSPGLWYTLPLTGTGGGFTYSTEVALLVGGRLVYLPTIAKE